MRPSGLIKKGRRASTFSEENLDYVQYCFVGANIWNWSESLPDNYTRLKIASQGPNTLPYLAHS